MSLSIDGVWKAGVWEETVWADGVWREGAAASKIDQDAVAAIQDLLNQKEQAHREAKKKFNQDIERTLKETLEGKPESPAVEEIVREFVPRKKRKKIPESGKVPVNLIDYSRLINDVSALQSLLSQLSIDYRNNLIEINEIEAIELLLLAET